MAMELRRAVRGFRLDLCEISHYFKYLRKRKRRHMSKEQYMFRQRMRRLALFIAAVVIGVVLVVALVVLAGGRSL